MLRLHTVRRVPVAYVTVYDSEAARDRDPVKPGFDDCAPNTQPNGLKFGEYIVHIW